jgi:chromosome segregation ATPase
MRRTAHALAVESDEVPVISNESLEAHFVSLRTELTDLKADFREQFREVRQDTRELQADNKILRDKIDATHSSLDKKIETKVGELGADLKEMRASLADLKGMQKAILWVLGGVGTLVATVGVGFTIARALHWI